MKLCLYSPTYDSTPLVTRLLVPGFFLRTLLSLEISPFNGCSPETDAVELTFAFSSFFPNLLFCFHISRRSRSLATWRERTASIRNLEETVNG